MYTKNDILEYIHNIRQNNFQQYKYAEDFIIPIKINCLYCLEKTYFKSIFHYTLYLQEQLKQNNRLKIEITNLQYDIEFIIFVINLSLEIDFLNNKNIIIFNIIRHSLHHAECSNCKQSNFIYLKYLNGIFYIEKIIFPTQTNDIVNINNPEITIFNKNFITKYCKGQLISKECDNENKLNIKDKKSLNCMHSLLDFSDIKNMMLTYNDLETITDNKLIEYFLKNKMYKDAVIMINFIEDIKKSNIKYSNNSTMRDNSHIMLRNILFNNISKDLWNNIYNNSHDMKIYRSNKFNIFNKVTNINLKIFDDIINTISDKYKLLYFQTTRGHDTPFTNYLKEKRKDHNNIYNNENCNYNNLWNDFIIKQYCIDETINNIDPTIFTYHTYDSKRV